MDDDTKLDPYATGWPPEAVRFRGWDFDKGEWYWTGKVTHRPRDRESVLTVCGLNWLGSHTESVPGPATCKRCAADQPTPPTGGDT